MIESKKREYALRAQISDFKLRYPDFQLRLTHLLQQEAHSPAVMKASGLVGQLGKPRVDSGSATLDAGECRRQAR